MFDKMKITKSATHVCEICSKRYRYRRDIDIDKAVESCYLRFEGFGLGIVGGGLCSRCKKNIKDIVNDYILSEK